MVLITDACRGWASASATTTHVEVAATSAVVAHTAGPRRRPISAARNANASRLPIGTTRGTTAAAIVSTNGYRWRQNRAAGAATATSRANMAPRTVAPSGSFPDMADPSGENTTETMPRSPIGTANSSVRHLGGRAPSPTSSYSNTALIVGTPADNSPPPIGCRQGPRTSRSAEATAADPSMCRQLPRQWDGDVSQSGTTT